MFIIEYIHLGFALFMERHGYKILLFIGVVLPLIFVLGGLGYFMEKLGHYTTGEAALFLGLLIVASLIGASAGRFMNTATTLASRIRYTYWSKMFEGKDRLKKRQEKLREEGGKLY